MFQLIVQMSAMDVIGRCKKSKISEEKSLKGPR